MTRVLQLRRGSTSENDNFTGLLGEITLDTDMMTIRVHDGRTLGGFSLARTDSVSIGDFDINSVPDEFWQSVILRNAPPALNVSETNPIPIISQVNYLHYITDITTQPKFIDTALICQSPEAGYAIGDVVHSFGVGNFGTPRPNYRLESGILNIYFMVGFQYFWVNHFDTGAVTQISDNNWKILFRIYY